MFDLEISRSKKKREADTMSIVKSLMYNTETLFAVFQYRPKRNLINKIVKELIHWQTKAA